MESPFETPVDVATDEVAKSAVRVYRALFLLRERYPDESRFSRSGLRLVQYQNDQDFIEIYPDLRLLAKQLGEIPGFEKRSFSSPNPQDLIIDIAMRKTGLKKFLRNMDNLMLHIEESQYGCLGAFFSSFAETQTSDECRLLGTQYAETVMSTPTGDFPSSPRASVNYALDHALTEHAGLIDNLEIFRQRQGGMDAEIEAKKTHLRDLEAILKAYNDKRVRIQAGHKKARERRTSPQR